MAAQPDQNQKLVPLLRAITELEILASGVEGIAWNLLEDCSLMYFERDSERLRALPAILREHAARLDADHYRFLTETGHPIDNAWWSSLRPRQVEIPLDRLKPNDGTETS